MVGFLIMDSTQSSQGTLGGGPRTEFASIGDQEINPNDYRQAVAKAQNEYLVRQQRVVDAVQGNFRFDDATTFNLQEQAWTQLVNDKLIAQELLERKNFGYPPFVRMVDIMVSHKQII